MRSSANRRRARLTGIIRSNHNIQQELGYGDFRSWRDKSDKGVAMNRNKLITVLMILVVMLVLAACSKYDPVLPPDIKMNPHPVEKYKAVMTIEGPPTQLKVTGKGNFGIKNTGYCVPVDSRRSLGGSRPQFLKDIDLQVTIPSENMYEIIFYADSIKDENYYGKGICEWSGSPTYRIYTPRTTYAVPIDPVGENGKAITKFCQINPSSERSACLKEEFIRTGKENYFSVRVEYYKE